jgi:hypothetical protein
MKLWAQPKEQCGEFMVRALVGPLTNNLAMVNTKKQQKTHIYTQTHIHNSFQNRIQVLENGFCVMPWVKQNFCLQNCITKNQSHLSGNIPQI